MSQSNHRIKEPNTVHHLTSRMAHRVFFLKEDQRNDFMSMMHRVSYFTGVRLLGWCIMENHFHILAYLPVPQPLSDEDVIRRYQYLCGREGIDIERYEFVQWSTQGDAGAEKTLRAVDRLRRRMYSIPWFMKTIKQWFTEEYNRREGHKGTLWEAVYHDRVISDYCSQTTRDCLAYIHLNPIRAAITPDFDAYAWSSLHDAAILAQQVRPAVPNPWQQIALEGLRFVFGQDGLESGGMTDAEIIALHHQRMCELLESAKLERAEAIARKRIAGFPVAADPLTDEAMLAQAKASVDRMQQAVIDLHAEREIASRPAERRALLIREIKAILQAYPEMQADQIAELIGKPRRTAYRYIALAKAS